MKSTDVKSKLLNKIFKVVMHLLLLLGMCGILLSCTLSPTSLPGTEARTPYIPIITFNDVGPCLDANGERIEKFMEGDPQWICATLKTYELPESEELLDLHIYKIDDKRQVFVDGTSYNSGYLSYFINPSLPPGEYGAYISWARSPLIEFEFEVMKKANP